MKCSLWVDSGEGKRLGCRRLSPAKRRSQIARRRCVVLAAALSSLSTIAGATQGNQVSWIAEGGSNLWQEAYHWNNNSVPTDADDVIISRPTDVVVTINGNAAARTLVTSERLVLKSGTFNLSGTAQVNNTFTLQEQAVLSGGGDFFINADAIWTDQGSMTGTGRTIISSTGSLSFTPGSYSKSLSRVLENYGTVTYLAAAYNNPAINMSNGAIINRSSGTWTHTINGGFFGASGTNSFVNEGTFIRSGTGTTTFGGVVPVQFHNNGNVQAQQGTLWLQGAGTHSGSFAISPGATLTLEGGQHFLAGSSVNNSGSLIFAALGDNLINGTINSTGSFTISAATHTFNGALTATNLDVSGGTMNFNAPAELGAPTFTNMTLGGSADVTITNSGTWTASGVMNGSGRTIVAPGAKLTLFSQTLPKTISRTMLNQGTIDWSGVGSGAVLNLVNGAINNLGTFNVLGDNYSINGASGTNVFNNSGQFVKSGTGAASITGAGASAVLFNNSGTMSVGAGTLTFDTTLSNQGRVNLAGGSIVLNNGISNSSLLNVSGGVLTLGGTNTTAALGLFAVSGSGQINVMGVLDNSAAILSLSDSTGSLRMMPGSRLVGGTLTTSGLAYLDLVSSATLDGVTMSSATVHQQSQAYIQNGLTLAGTLTLTSSTNVTLTFLGPPTVLGTGDITTGGASSHTTTIAGTYGATLTFTPNITIHPGTRDLVVGTGSETIIAQGRMLADASGRTLMLSGSNVTNAGTFEAKNGGTLSLTGNITNLSGNTLTGGIWKVSSGGAIKVGTSGIINNSAVLILDGASSGVLLNNSSDALAGLAVNLPAGNLQILNGRSFNTLNGFTNQGTLTVGPGASFNLPLALNPPAVFNNSGTATIGGTLLSHKTVNEGLMTLSGTHSISTDLILGNSSPSARFDMTGGMLSIGAMATIGDGVSGAGTFNLSGGNMSVGKALVISTTSTNASSFTLSGSANLNVAELTVAALASRLGSFTQTGGTVNIAAGSSGLSGQLYLAVSTLPNTVGNYTMSGGALNNQGATIGWGTNANFAQSGGVHTISGTNGLILGLLNGGKGNYGMSNGATLNVAAGEIIGYLGQGTFNQTGGLHISGGVVDLGSASGGTGTFNLAGGTFNAASENIGNGGVGLFNQTGGSHSVSGTMTLGVKSGSSGTVNLSGGTVTAGTINLIRGTFNQTGGTLSATAFNQNGGLVLGTLQNQGTFTYNSGAFSGRLLNQGTAVLNLNFTASNGLDNRAAFNVAGNRAVTLNGAGLSNAGTIAVSGTMTAALTINHGTLTQSAGSGVYGNISGTGSLSVLGGSISAGLLRQNTVNIQNDGRVALTNGAGAARVNSLDIGLGSGISATLDLGNNALIVDYSDASPLSNVQSLVGSGFNSTGTRWTGPGITSAAAAANPTMGLGVVEASAALRISGAQTASFQGQTVDASSILVFMTRLGDTNLDGKVTFGDFQRLEVGYGTTNATWYQGDFNYDGAVDFADFTLLYQNYGQSMAGAPLPSAPAELAALNVFAASVPEPGVMGLMGIAGAALMMRRTRRRI